jgi:peptide/nickel transport system substrate-binding protein
MYMLGWGGSITDAETTFTSIYRNRAEKGIGEYNRGNFKDDELDAIVAASSKEPDVEKRKALIKKAMLLHNEQVRHIPLHRQFIPWAARKNVNVVHRPDNWLEMQWVKM